LKLASLLFFINFNFNISPYFSNSSLNSSSETFLSIF